ncbi:MAG: galactose-1-phosphate uridylyltransferase [Eubacteriaceae bacterium]|nr:galactose-1-phosphate uridylyltransferase [Eubacteriaceae bacterium]
MSELRYHPLTDDWVIINSNRQARPDMPKDYCAFCPGSGKVPEGGYDILRYPNDFPSMSLNPPEPDDLKTDFYRYKPAYGICEVILYSSSHNATLKELSPQSIRKLGLTWREIYRDFSSDVNIKNVMIFENRGKEVGVTMSHPHGQAYGYGFVPKKIRLEAQNAENYHKAKGSCIFCDMLADEKNSGERIIFENEYFTVFLPFFTEYPYGVYILPNRHISDMGKMTDEMASCLAETIQQVSGMYDSLFDKAFPYMMCMHNPPLDGRDYSAFWDFHVEFFPPLRGENSIKWNASSETGAWAHCNPTCPEQKARELREANDKYLRTKQEQ